MKFGLKLWSTNYRLVEEAAKLLENQTFNYIELMPIPDTDIAALKKIEGPFVIHATTEKYGFNISDNSKTTLNTKILDMCLRWADSLHSDTIIVHPGYGSLDTAADFLGKVNDERILIENMPKVGMNDENMVGYTRDQLKLLMADKFGLCLDFSHAIKAAISLKVEYRNFVEDLLTLNPKVFHISDGRIDNAQDEHLHFGDGDFAIDFLLGCLAKCSSQRLTLETLRTSASFEEDVKNLNFLKGILRAV